MTAQPKTATILGVDLKVTQNNPEHHTGKISKEILIVRRGQSFNVSLQLNQPYSPELYKLTFTAQTGNKPEENLGTKSVFGIPDEAKRLPKAKAVWKAELSNKLNPEMGGLILKITPPADAPVGKYSLSVNHSGQEKALGTLVVLFNPWCPADWVFMANEDERQEYVMNQHGIIYRGSGNYISPMNWDYGQFEENMVQICLTILDRNLKHLKEPGADVSARCNPIYVSRIVSAMINSEDDRGVVEGCWGDSFIGGESPTHWNGSHAILKRWLSIGCQPVKYGQCWVFAGVMCSVLRLLGIPTRVVTNFQSAHDSNKNLIIDTYHADYGVREIDSPDSVWNFHVWVEAWMKRPDLKKGYDGWQVVDPTPQEKSGGVYCCGPAPVKAILNGDTDLKYDVPFIFAEVNADVIDWLVKADGSKVQIVSDTKRVGQNISTKSVGSDKRMNITDNYKQIEGTEKERAVFKYAITRDYSKDEGDLDDDILNNVTDRTMNGNAEETPVTNEGTSLPTPPQVTIKFEEVSKPLNGEDVKLNLVLHSEATVSRSLSINLKVQAMKYHGSPSGIIQTELKDETLLPGQDLSIPIVVQFSEYWKLMLESHVLKILAVVSDKQQPSLVFLAESDVVLLDPPIDIKVLNEATVRSEVSLEVVFLNPVKETLKDCTLTLSGSGLLKEPQKVSLPDLRPSTRFRASVSFVPYKTGLQTLLANFDCSMFRNIKSSCSVNVK